MDTAMSLNPIGIIIIALVALAAGFYELWKHFAAFRDFWKDAWKDVRGAAVDAWHFIDNNAIHPLMSGITKLVSWIRTHWKLLAVILATVLLGPIAGLIAFIATHWNTFRRITSEVVSDVAGFFRSLPGKIVSGLAALPSMLFSAGRNAIMGLLHGAQSMVGSVMSTVSGWGHDIANAIGSPFGIHFSEPSQAALMVKAGRQITLGLARGMTSETGAARAAAARVGVAAGIAGGGAALAGAGGGGRLQIEWVGGSGADQQFITWLKKNIRLRGGDTGNLGR